jgi:hypothetical protein
LTPELVLLVESKVSDLRNRIPIIILKTIGYPLSIVHLATSAGRLLDVPRYLRTEESCLLRV